MRAAEATRVIDGLLLLVRVTEAGQAAGDAAEEGIAGADALGVEPGAIPDLVARGELGQAVLLDSRGG